MSDNGWSSRMEGFTGVTAKIKQLQTKPFDRDAQAILTAEKRGISVQDVLAEWEASRKAGVALHSYIDNVLEGNEQEPLLTPQQHHFDTWWAENQSRYLVIGTEVKVVNHTFKLSGRYDALLWDTQEQIHIMVDWKPSYETWGFAPLKEPFNMLWDSKHVMTSLQLSTYWLMNDMSMASATVSIEEAWIVAIDKKGLAVHKATDYRKLLLVWLSAQ